MQIKLAQLGASLEGSFYYNNSAEHQVQLMAYATDASVYQERPLAVALPLHKTDIRRLILFAAKEGITLIPRAAGTSLAGQVVGSGIVVDISRHFNTIHEVNPSERWVRVDPGVIRDDLNHYLFSQGLMFGPETSTANRAMTGGMVGNNSCGLHSIVWGSVRDHLLEVTMLLNDGSEVIFKKEDISGSSLHGRKKEIYDALYMMLANETNQQSIMERFPKATVVRRNTGYALDSLLLMQPFDAAGKPFNLCALIAGSEGTLGFITEIKLGLLPLPPKHAAIVCVHCSTLDESLRANIVALQHKPMASELVDKYIMDFTIGHPEYSKNRFFIEGDPAALLLVEFMENSTEAAGAKATQLIGDLNRHKLGYAYPVLHDEKAKYAWDIRKAGLGLLRNLKGDTQPVNLIEDCAVAPDELPDYIADLQHVLKRHAVNASYYAHAGAGELHVEPMINLKTPEGVATFRNVLKDTVELVKKYNGSLSGEHGDGRLRGEFIADVVGKKNYALFQQVKNIFDPTHIFNAGKITGTAPMDAFLRVQLYEQSKPASTTFDFSAQDGILKLAEKCSGSGDCRKSEISGGLMCPSYMATRREIDTTRARANVLRQFLSNPADLQPFNHKEVKEVMDLCLSCKGCKIECPSSVDITKMKAEFLQQYYDANGTPTRARLIGGFSAQMKLAARFSFIYNAVFGTAILRKILNKTVGFHPDRTMPRVASTTLRSWFKRREKSNPGGKEVYFFCDEFTNYLDVEIGQKTVLLLEALGYKIIFPQHFESGRTWLSKGLVRKAKELINKNIELLCDAVPAEAPLVGIEPSAILTLRDEYPDLADTGNREKALRLSKHVFTIEEFIFQEMKDGHIHSGQFTDEERSVYVHGHCYQKVLSSQEYSRNILGIPQNYKVYLIASGCCGMAGSFGYEKEHYEVSQQVGELVLFPAVRKLKDENIIAAAGTSCRHQIKDGTGKKALHPVEVLWDALIKC